jgi:hypothetical protein
MPTNPATSRIYPSMQTHQGLGEPVIPPIVKGCQNEDCRPGRFDDRQQNPIPAFRPLVKVQPRTPPSPFASAAFILNGLSGSKNSRCLRRRTEQWTHDF